MNRNQTATIMMRIWKYTMMVMLAAMTACTGFDEEGFRNDDNPVVPEGYDLIDFTVAGYGMNDVATRAVDIDGGGIADMRLFCFDRYGLFITTSVAEFPKPEDLKEGETPNGLTTGRFKAIIPRNTRIVHFLANQNMTNYPEDMFHGKSELEVLGLLEGSSGKMIYWSRVKAPETVDAEGEYTESFAKHIMELSEKPEASITFPDGETRKADVWMIRNHAMIKIQNNTDPEKNIFTTTGLAVYNSMAFGTVAPLEDGDFPEKWPGEKDYVTLPVNRTKLTDATSVQGVTIMSDGSQVFGQYVFECENLQEDPVSVILRGYNTEDGSGSELYYRVMLQDQQGNMIKIRRNHRYNLNIIGRLNYGQATFQEALEAPATNNIWVSISDDIREVQNNSEILTVEKTAYVEDAPTAASQSIDIYYNLTTLDGELTDKPEISWLDMQNVSENVNLKVSGVHRYGDELTSTELSEVIGGETYNGRIRLTLSQMQGLQKREGTLLIKSGQLQRKVKVITIAEQSFEPAWASSQVYGVLVENNTAVDKKERAHSTLMFTIPETTPDELFPMRVLISTNKLDVRSAAGQTLPIVSRGQEGFGDESYSFECEQRNSEGKIVVDEDGKPVMVKGTFTCDYKYVLEVTKPGVQRVYFENIMDEGNNAFERIFIEGEHFATIHKDVEFTNQTLSISIDELASYNISDQDDEKIKFFLVPQKVNAPVDLSMILHSGRAVDNDLTIIAPNTAKIPAGQTNAGQTAYDEFLFYSQHLDAPEHHPGLTGDALTTGEAANPDIYLKESRKSFWSTNGRMHLFWVKKQFAANATDFHFGLSMVTTRANSAEPVRISSNESGHSYINLPADASSSVDGGTYYGRSFRSLFFELANYRPFRFAAKVMFDNDGNYQGTLKMKDPANPNKEVTDVKEGYVEVTDDIYFPYANIGAPVDLAIDVTSFTSNPWENTTVTGKLSSVDPFGTSFDIYIDAPMLSLNTEAQMVKDHKLEAVEGVPGRFVYHVDADRDKERNGTLEVEIKDTAPMRWQDVGKASPDNYTPNQSGERKVLPFLTNTIVTSGNITISTKEADASDTKVVFYDKSFNVQNTPEIGKIYYNDGTENKLIGAGEFVVVQRDYDHQRLATMTVTAPDASGNNYQLRLRKEYSFSWTDDIELQFTKDGAVYSTKMTLSELCEDEDGIVLNKVQ